MTLAEIREKCKGLIARAPRDMLIIGVLVLASVFSFGLGYLAGVDEGRTVNTVVIESTSLEETTTAVVGQVVASKSGTKYYLPSCSGVDRISEANKVWFASAALARQAGYTPAANCKGL